MEEQLKFDVAGNLETRKGVYANTVFISSQPSEDVLDFYFMDGSNSDGAMTGVIVSRVIMSRNTLLSFRGAIDRHLGIETHDAD